MNILSLGSKGPQVGQVQTRLNEIYEEQLDVNNDFGELTEEMVMVFQVDNDLVCDGIVGPATWAALFKEADLEDALPVPKLVPDPPSPPSPYKAVGQSQLTALFGKPKDPAPYLVVMDFKEFKKDFAKVKDYVGNPWSCRVYGHKLMEASLRAAFKNLVSSGFVKELMTFDGCVCVRPMTSGNGWSVHSWGLAIDFNASRNPYGSKPKFSAGFAKCFTDAGFEWGGKWNTPDGMHFQIPRTWL